jgi:hypothetical protein
MTGGQSAVRMNDRHSFPVDGLVELSRATYHSTPLVVVEIRPTVFSFIGAGGTVTAVGGSQECTVIDTGYGPRVPEIRSAIAWGLHQSPRWLIDTHWHFDHTDGNSTFAEDQTRWWAMQTAGRACLKINSLPRSNGACEARRARHGPF